MNATLNRAWFIRCGSPAEKLVLVRLADRANASGVTFPTIKSLAEDCGLDERSVRRALATLEAAGHVTRAEISGRGYSQKSRYNYRVLPVPTPDILSTDTGHPVHCDTGHPVHRHRTSGPPTPDILSTTYIENPQRLTPNEPPGREVIPSALNTVGFKAAWEDWKSYRSGLRNKPKNPARMFAEQLRWLSGFGPEVSVEILRQSIRNGWQGLFEPKGADKRPAPAPSAPAPKGNSSRRGVEI